MKKFQGEEGLMRSSFRSRRFEGISGIAFSKTGDWCTYKGEDVRLETRKVVSSERLIFSSTFYGRIGKTIRGCTKKYEGRKNTRTFLKGVAFICGDEYVTTGGDWEHFRVGQTDDGTRVQTPGDSQSRQQRDSASFARRCGFWH